MQAEGRQHFQEQPKQHLQDQLKEHQEQLKQEQLKQQPKEPHILRHMKEVLPSAPWERSVDREDEERRRENHGERQEIQNPNLKPQQQSELKPHQQEAKSSEQKPKLDQKNLTVMEKHCEFFDRNKDGIIYPRETWEGLRAIGFGYFLSFIGVLFIHLSFSFFASRSWIPSPRLALDVKMMHKCKHGSDSEVYDHDGRMDKKRLDELFKKYSDRPDSISVRNMFRMTQDKWEALDVFGWIAAKFEWGFLAILVATDDWRIRREDIEAQFDGTLFYKLEERNKAKLEERKKAKEERNKAKGKGKRPMKTD